MPTAAKLFAGFSFLLVGFFAAEVLKPSFPEGFGFGYFTQVCAFLGLLAGWRVMGRSTGKSFLRSASSGLKTSFVLTIWALTVFSVREVLLRSTARRYDNVLEAIEATFAIMLDFATILVGSYPTLAVLVLGGMLGGVFASWAAVRWR